MTGEDFTAWLAHMELSDAATARLLGISRNTVVKYKAEGTPEHFGWACAALAFGLQQWKRPAG